MMMEDAACAGRRGIIFDLDGTLLDSLEDLADASNAVLVAEGLATHPAGAYRFFVGDGMQNLMRRAAPSATEEEVRRLVAAMGREYAENWAVKSRPYEGIAAMLEGVRARGLPMAVLSNKPHVFTERVVGHFFPEADFVRVQGSPENGRAKPDPSLALDIARTMALPPKRVLFVGDSSTDMDTAAAAGMIPVGVLWGFRPEDELRAHGAQTLLARPEDLFDYI